MRLFAFVCVLGFFAGFASDKNQDARRLVVHKLSTLTISGKTNVNEYQCVIAQYTGADTLLLTGERGKSAFFTKGLVKLKASDFDCGMQVMTNDFVKTIKADDYPFITIEFISFERMPEYESSEEKFKGKLTISIANVTKPYQVRCGVVKDKNNFIHLTGSSKVKFADFNLEPPSKMMGMIKVEEKIKVNFHLVLQEQ